MAEARFLSIRLFMLYFYLKYSREYRREIFRGSYNNDFHKLLSFYLQDLP